MSVFSDHMKAHLARYKREQMGITEDGMWRGNARAYEHILPEAEHRQNILPTIRDEFWAYAKEHESQLALHTDFHHLNSSQAFAFNLFFPWTAPGESSDALLRALGYPGAKLVSWRFEDMPDEAERTSVDFLAKLGDGTRLLVEVKLTEEDFGTVVPKESHREKLRTVYTPRLAGKARAESLAEDVFFPNYQLFRNVSHLDLTNGDKLLLLVPRANKNTWQQGERFRDHLEPAAQGALRMLSVEELLEFLTQAAKGMSPKLETHMRQMREKYLPEVVV